MYQFRSRIFERLFRDILRMFCSDISALIAAKLAGYHNHRDSSL